VVFDRNGYLYHGRLAELAGAAPKPSPVLEIEYGDGEKQSISRLWRRGARRVVHQSRQVSGYRRFSFSALSWSVTAMVASVGCQK
jgi:hypothetical protein